MNLPTLLLLWLPLLLLLLLSLARSQGILQMGQYNALMQVYAELRATSTQRPLFTVAHSDKLSLLKTIECNNATACPRFSANSSCTGTAIECVAGNVTSL
jgi:hypothetical protein